MIKWKEIREAAQEAVLVVGFLLLLVVVVGSSWAVGSFWASVAW